jgi:hypothetical protein
MSRVCPHAYHLEYHTLIIFSGIWQHNNDIESECTKSVVVIPTDVDTSYDHGMPFPTGRLVGLWYHQW